MTKASQPAIEVSDIFRRFRHLLEPLALNQAKVVSDIMNCRTSVLGGHRLRCDAVTCDHQEFSYNSCRNRHCSKCQFLAQKKWVEARREELLPVQYFHAVFSISHELNPLLWCNKRIGYNILFQAMSETFKEVAERRLKAQIGFTAVLHTWGQTLTDHAHIHAIVPGGGISLDGTKWISAPANYLLPLKVLAKVFRGKFLNYLEEAFSKLEFPGKCEKYKDPKIFKGLLIAAAKKDWIVYAKAPFAGPEQVLQYLGNYTHRIAISNHRIKSIEDGHVVFSYKDRADDNKPKTMKLAAKEFMRRFLLHVLPTKFVRMRHFGLLGSKNKQKNLELARKLLGAKKIEKVQDKNWQDFLLRITGHDITQCPKCKNGHLVKVETILPHPSLRRLKHRRDTS